MSMTDFQWIGVRRNVVFPRTGTIVGDPRIATTNAQERPVVQPPTVTTTVQPQGDGSTTQTVVVDISTNPFLRTIDVNFVGHSFRPQRRSYFFFDDTNVTNYVQRPSVISVPGVVNFNSTLGRSDIISSGTGNTAILLHSAVNPDTGNTDLFVTSVVGTFVPGASISGTISGNSAAIVSYSHRSGTATAAGANSITLAADASSVSNYYVGNTIYICAGSGIGQTGLITAYDGTNRVANVQTNWTTALSTNTRYSIGNTFIERNGSIAGTFIIPSNDSLRFRTGERIFRIIDREDNSVPNSTSRGDFRWIGLGTTEVRRDIVIQRPPQPAPPPPAPIQPIVIPQITRLDPVAQTFYVDEALYTSGVFITSIDVFFETKDSILPVTLQIRPVVNGFPHSSEILKGGTVTVYPENIRTSSVPSVTDPSTATTFRFPAPLYLEPGKEYAMVLLSDSLEYNVYVSELGKQIIGTNRVVSTQPYLGSFFKSQNSSTWTPIQEEDLMFVLRKAVFNTSSTATIDFYNETPASGSINVDTLYVRTSEEVYSNNSLRYFYSRDSGVTYNEFIPKKSYDLVNRFSITANNQFRLRAQLSTNDKHISPVVYTEKMLFVGAENIVDDLSLSNSDIVIINGGTGYLAGDTSNVVVTISGGGGSGAVAAVSNISGGAIQAITLSNPGSGYTGQASISFSGGSGVNANAIIAAETSSQGGPADARYVTRVVTLAEGFDAGDIRAYITAYKPLGTEIYLYYKVKNLADPEPFENKSWTLMTQKTPSTLFSDDVSDFIEYEYRGSSSSSETESISYTSGNATYDRFNQFAIKIVLRAAKTTVVPIVYDLRAIALAPYSSS
jgi:hypothetical protein